MAKEGDTTTAASTAATAAATPLAPTVPLTWRQVWQVPALIAAAGLFVGGVAIAFLRAPKPNHDDAFARAEAFIKDEKFGEAIEALNHDVLPHLAAGSLRLDQTRRYHADVARSLFLGQKALRIDREENNLGIVEQYEHLERIGGELDERDIGYYAETLIALGRQEEAQHRLESLPESARELRIALWQRMIERVLRGGTGGGHGGEHAAAHGSSHGAPQGPGQGPDHALALDLIGRMSTEGEVPPGVRAWAAARQAEILLAQGYAQDAIARLLRSIQRLDAADPRAMAELHTLLARGYIQTEGYSEARGQLDKAEGLVRHDDPLMASILLLQARVEFNFDKAKSEERYTQVIERFPHHPEAIAALLGLAEVHSLLGAREESIQRYTALVDRLGAGETSPEVSLGRVGASLMNNFRERFDVEDYEGAMRFGSLCELLFDKQPLPADLLKALAEVNQKLGEETLRAAAGDSAISLARADPATQAVVRRHFIESGGYFKQHADTVVLTDTSEYGASIWSAAEMFDRAGDGEDAIEMFRLFVSGFPSDARLPEAKFRLARAYHARGDLATAEKLYKELIDSREQEQGAGPVADASYVPLARVWLADADPANDADAERMLTAAISGEMGGPTTENYRIALTELANQFYRTQRPIDAIERFTEILERYGHEPEHASKSHGPDPAIEMSRFRLADSHRLAAHELDAQLRAGGLPDSTRRQLEEKRVGHLKSGLTHFEKARRGLESLAHRGELEDRCLRNAYFYLGESAFDLEDYEGAVRHYDAAKERYPNDPASLVAMTQIVSAYKALGQADKARTANARAKRFFESLPDSVWDDPSLPMDRRAWERWLDSSIELSQAGNTHTPALPEAPAAPGGH